MTRRVLLTGASGFVGRQVLRALHAAGTEVVVVARTPHPLAAEDAALAAHIIHTDDLFAEDDTWWATQAAGVHTVVHAAWYAEPGQYVQSPRNMDCLIGTLALARGVTLAGVRRVVGIGTCAEYDLSGGDVSVDTPLDPRSPYAAAKAATWLLLSRSLPAHAVSFAWCRLFYLYGEHEDARRLVPYVRGRLAAGEPVDLTAGTQVRDFLDVRDAGRKIAAVALGQQEGAVNICSGVPVSVREVVERIADEYGRRDLLRFGARAENRFDPPRVVGVP